MNVDVSLEMDALGHALAFAFDFPGASGWGKTINHALAQLKKDIVWTHRWTNVRGLTSVNLNSEPQFNIVERLTSTGVLLYADSEGFFEYDKQVYSNNEVERTLLYLKHSRVHLMKLVADVPLPHYMIRLVEGKRTLNEILDHIAIAEWWYMTRVSQLPIAIADDWRKLKSGPLEKLEEVRELTLSYLNALSILDDKKRNIIEEHQGERWSYRKVLRRMIWHELLHIKQIERLKPKLGESSVR